MKHTWNWEVAVEIVRLAFAVHSGKGIDRVVVPGRASGCQEGRSFSIRDRTRGR